MSSRCDRLGELLSAALTEGTIPEYPHESAVGANVAESAESGAGVWKTSAHGDEPEERRMPHNDLEDDRQEWRHASGQRQKTRSSAGEAETPAGGASVASAWKTSAHGDETEERRMPHNDFEDDRQERRHASGQRQQTRSCAGEAENPAGGAGSSSVIRRERLPPVLTPEALAAYRALGLAAGSPMSAVKKAYRTLLKKYHPDNTAPFENMQRTAAQKTDRIVQAFKVLEDWFARCRP